MYGVKVIVRILFLVPSPNKYQDTALLEYPCIIIIIVILISSPSHGSSMAITQCY